MSIAQLVAGTVMNKSAVLLNDVNRTTYTYAIQVPYLQLALQELQEYYELNNISVTQKASSVILVDAGITEIAYDAGPALAELPDDMVEPQQLWERQRGIDPFVPMTKREYLPHSQEGVLTNQLVFYVWQDQKLKFLPSNQNNDIKIDYIKELFADIVDSSSAINLVNARSFLEFRTAGLIAEFIEHNDAAAEKMNGYASLAMERATGISIKGKQTIMTRRRPFRSGYKRRGRIT